MVALTGTDMTPNYVDSSFSNWTISPWCTCKGSGNQEEECMNFLRYFTDNTCLSELFWWYSRNGMWSLIGIQQSCNIDANTGKWRGSYPCYRVRKERALNLMWCNFNGCMSYFVPLFLLPLKGSPVRRLLMCCWCRADGGGEVLNEEKMMDRAKYSSSYSNIELNGNSFKMKLKLLWSIVIIRNQIIN